VYSPANLDPNRELDNPELDRMLAEHLACDLEPSKALLSRTYLKMLRMQRRRQLILPMILLVLVAAFEIALMVLKDVSGFQLHFALIQLPYVPEWVLPTLVQYGGWSLSLGLLITIMAMALNLKRDS
jgi:hypothetical protein